MPNRTDEEIIADGKSWKAWGEQFGWRCYGFTGPDSAGFHRIEDGERGLPFTITGKMRADIDEALHRDDGSVFCAPAGHFDSLKA